MDPRRSGAPPESVAGCLLGVAWGDALGLPYEGLTARRARRLLGPPMRLRLLPGRGMVSDDTEHTVMIALSFQASGGDPERFARCLAWHLRLWFLALPAGMGLATGRAVMKLLVGFPPSRSGVFSAGNGPAMRAPLIGVLVRDRDELLSLTEASTRITHRDPKALHGAVAVALAAHLGAGGRTPTPREYLAALRETLGADAHELLELIERVVTSVDAGEDTQQFVVQLGLERGISGYVLHTVPACIHAWLSNAGAAQDAVRGIIECGGDADTTAAIVGGIAGAQAGADALPATELAALTDWPWNAHRLGELATSLTTPGVAPPRPWWLLRLPRNLFFLGVVLLHGFRRLLPPY